MTNRGEAAGKLPPYERGTSPGALYVELGVGHAPEPVKATLPQAYGIPLLELLIVDPEYVFVSWEITAQQLEQARADLGQKGFARRQLILRLRNIDLPGDDLVEQELYGEIGRWFISHQLAGRRVTAELGFRAADSFTRLHQAGPIELPRDFVIEPTQYDELHVQYGLGASGGLLIEGLHRHELVPWPAVRLPLPSAAELAIQLDPAVHEAGHGVPSSPGPGLPVSPWSGGIFQPSDADADDDKDGEA